MQNEKLSFAYSDQCSSELLDTNQAAKFLNTTPRFLKQARTNGTGPDFCLMGAKTVRYRLCDLVAWVEGRLKSSTKEG